MMPFSNLSNLANLRMQVFGTPHGPFQNPGSVAPMPVRSPMLPAYPSAGAGSGMPSTPGLPVAGSMAAPARPPIMAPQMAIPAQGTAMPANGMNFSRLNALQSLGPMMRRGPMSY